jgi:hypothetical protein
MRDARIGFLAIATLIAASFPVRQETPEPASRSGGDAGDADWNHVDGHYWTLKELYQRTTVVKPEDPGAGRK